jgi:hypothetical protein
MATFSISSDSTSVDVSLIASDWSPNTWYCYSGNYTIFGTKSGTWIFSQTAKTLNLNTDSNVSVCQFLGINMTTTLGDVFQNVKSGATGEADVGPTVMRWTRTDGAPASGASADGADGADGGAESAGGSGSDGDQAVASSNPAD